MRKKVLITLISLIASQTLAATKNPFVAECSVNSVSADTSGEKTKPSMSELSTTVKGAQSTSNSTSNTNLKNRTAQASHDPGCGLTK